MTEHPLSLTGAPLTPAEVESVARTHRAVAIAPDTLRALAESRSALESAASDGEPHYGVNTGFGSFSKERISDDQLRDLQRNLLRSHAAGVGNPLPEEVVRAMLLTLAASLCRALSGVRPKLVQSITNLLNARITPIVPESGSVGASGDLAPLAHATLVLLGEGEARHNSERITGGEALRRAGLEPIELEAKEGLALINGTHLMAARAALLCCDINRLIPAALAACSMTLDACRATDAFLHPAVYEARNQPGPALVAHSLTQLLASSTIIPSHDTPEDPRVQDPYSIRCAPHVLGAAIDGLRPLYAALTLELGAVTDNPLVVQSDGEPKPEIVSAGNFHGMPIALPLDQAAIALVHIAGISERRVYHMLAAIDPDTNLRPFLSPKPGLHSGYMIAQYTAAALVNELATLATPATVTNIPTSAGMEDYNSFGPRSAAKAARAVALVRTVVAIELLCAAQGVETHRPLQTGRGGEAVIHLIRRSVPPLLADRPPSPDIEHIAGLIEDGSVADVLKPFVSISL